MPKLYGYPACPRSGMALVAASEKGVDCSFQAVASWDGLDNTNAAVHRGVYARNRLEEAIERLFRKA